MRLTVAVLALLLSAASAQAADTFTVLLDWFVNPDHAPLIVAQEMGAFAEEGLDVAFVPPGDSSMPPKLVAAGHGDVAITYQPQFFQQIDQHLPLVRVGTLIDRPLATLTALSESGIHAIADLRGKRLGYGSGDIEVAELGAILRTAGLALSDVTLVDVGDQLSVSLLTHQVDAVTVFRNFELFELREKGATPVTFDYEAFGVPAYDELILVARAEAAHDPKMVRFLRAWRRGVAYLQAHPEESLALFLKHHADLDDTLNRKAWAATWPTFARDPAAFDRAKYQAFASFLFDSKLISAVPDPKNYAVELDLR